MVDNEHSVITNEFLGEIGKFSTHINPDITNKNDRSRAVRYKPSLTVFILVMFKSHEIAGVKTPLLIKNNVRLFSKGSKVSCH